MNFNDSRVVYTRKPLAQALQKIWEFPLTVVEAPMGYGKTTAVREFFKDYEAQVLWQTIFDASAASFWHGFSRLFLKLDGVCANSLAELGVPGTNDFREEAVELIGNVTFSMPTVLVIDDYHLLSSKDTDNFFGRLIKAEIPGLHVVILSRSVFGENMAELTLKGYCLLLDRKYFELTEDEIAEYCLQCGVSLKPDETVFLHYYTEGWISAVYLCILGYHQAGRVERQSDTLHELIEKVVYLPCSTEMKEFLTVISIFDKFSLDQAEYMWQKGNANALLEQLMAENSFVKFDYISQTYHMHNILTGFLRRIFDRQASERRQALWKIAGEWYLSVGEYNSAMDYFYIAADFDKLMTAIETAKGAALARQPKETRIKYFQNCPVAIKAQHPLAGIIYAFNLFISNEKELFIKQCRELGGYIQDLPDNAVQFRLKLLGEMEVLKGITAFNNIVSMAEHFKEAWRLLQGPSAFVDTKVPWTLGSPSVLYLYYRESGQLESQVQAMKELPYYYRLSNGHGSGGEYMMEAEWFYYTGDFDNAEIVTHKALYIAQSQGQYGLVLCATFLQIRLALVKGDVDYALNSLLEARQAIREKALYSHMRILDLCEGFVFSCLNQLKGIPDWIVQGDLPDSFFLPNQAFYNIIWDKMLLISGQYHQLAGIAGQHAIIASIFPNLLAQVYTYIFEAAAQVKLGRREDAQVTLRKAIEIAAPDQVIMPFVENSTYIAELLTEMQLAGIQREFISKVCKNFPLIAERWEGISAKLNKDRGKSLLTKREAAVAELVAAGLSDKAVGKTLNIAEVTAKKALHSVYRKFGVSNRAALTRIIIEQKTE